VALLYQGRRQKLELPREILMNKKYIHGENFKNPGLSIQLRARKIALRRSAGNRPARSLAMQGSLTGG
jgi:hypothetical protein